MAKAAKHVKPSMPVGVVNKAVKDILAHYENIATSMARHMQAARQERDAMGIVYESMAAHGVSQRVMKVEIRIIRAIERIKGLYAELEAEERKDVQNLARAQNDKRQLSLLFDATPEKKPKTKKPRAEVVGNDLSQTTAAGSA